MEQGATFSGERKKSSRIKCCVKDCSSTFSKNMDVIFHRFPTQNKRTVKVKNYFDNVEAIDQFKAWTIALKVNKINSYTRVCSLHFKKDDYFFPNVQCKKRILKKTAVPSLNLPKISCGKKIESDTSRSERLRKRSKNNNLQHVTSNSSEQPIHLNLSEVEPIVEIFVKDVEEIPSETDGLQTFPVIQSSVDASVQVNTIFNQTKFSLFLKTDSDLSSFTGIENFKVLDTIIESIKIVKGHRFENNNIILNTKDRVIMTYIKLKLNLSYKCLSVMFGCYSAKHCQRIFEETIKLLYACLKVAITWPSRKEISMNLPNCFKDFEDVRVVLDCTEVFIQRPANFCCQVLTYSNYKGSETLKFLTGVTPAGNISFISKAYGGRVSDSCIFAQSDLVKLLEPGDAIMVDKGFLIDEICLKNQWKCIRPPFLKEKNQFSKSEAVLSCKIAAARVHIERSNQRLKTYKILSSKMPTILLHLSEEIFTVICATTNLCSPILQDDKFMDV